MGSGTRFSAHVLRGNDQTSALREAIEAAAGFGADCGLGQADAAKLAVVVEELVANLLDHGSQGQSVAFELCLERQGDCVVLHLDDNGPAFDPTRECDFNGPSIESGGGVGLQLVRTWAREFSYRREDDRNRITLKL